MGLGVLETTRPVNEAARSLWLETAAISRLADQLAERPFERPEWRVAPHWWDESEQTAQYVFVLDSLNFCFWGEPHPAGWRGYISLAGCLLRGALFAVGGGSPYRLGLGYPPSVTEAFGYCFTPDPKKWMVQYGGRRWDGYWALAACLRRALDEGVPLLDAEYLASIDLERTARLLRGEGTLLLLPERAESLQQLGQVLLARYRGQAANFVAACGGSAVELVRRLAEELPSFNDVATYDGETVKLYKRAQILCSDLHGAYAGEGPGRFDDLDQLTAFADYKLPQILREFGVLVYGSNLTSQVDAWLELPHGSREEVEIRAATVWAVELIRQRLVARGIEVRAFEIDWYLWELAQRMDLKHPYHRTRTVFY